MNKIYRVIWSKTKNCYVVASELAKRHTKAPQSGVVSKIAALALVGAMSFGFAGSALAAHLEATYIKIDATQVEDPDNPGNYLPPPPASAYAEHAIAIGVNAVADGADHAVAIGENVHISGNGNESQGDYSVGIGFGATAEGVRGVALGKDATITASHAIGVGTDSLADGMYSSVFGAYSSVATDSSVTMNFGGKDSAMQGFGATVLGSLNTSQTTGNSDKKFVSVASSIIGTVNTATNSNGALIFGAGNKIEDSYQDVIITGDMSLEELRAQYDAAVASGKREDMAVIAEKLQEMVKVSGGQVMAMGGDNEAKKAFRSQIIGVGNRLEGDIDETVTFEANDGTKFTFYKYNTQYDLLDGFENTVKNSQHVSVIGTGNTVDGSDGDIILGDYHKITGVTNEDGTKTGNNVIIGSGAGKFNEDELRFEALTSHAKGISDTVMLGHNSEVMGDNGVAVGSGSLVSEVKGVAVGSGSVASKSGSVAIGSGSLADESDGVALGSGSLANTAAGISGYDPLKGDASNLTSSAWKSTAAAVSVGNDAMKTWYGFKASTLQAGINDNKDELERRGVDTSLTPAELLNSLDESQLEFLAGVLHPSATSSENKPQEEGILFVSKPNSSMTRQITNVAAGLRDTDAVNVAQLKTSQTHYYSVNDNGTHVDNYNNDGALGTFSLAAGPNAKAEATFSLAAGSNVKAQGLLSTVVGAGSYSQDTIVGKLAEITNEMHYLENNGGGKGREIFKRVVPLIGNVPSVMGLGSTVIGSMNSVKNRDEVIAAINKFTSNKATAASTTVPLLNEFLENADFFDGIANTVVGTGNETEKANVALIYGTGNTIKNAYQALDETFDGEALASKLAGPLLQAQLFGSYGALERALAELDFSNIDGLQAAIKDGNIDQVKSILLDYIQNKDKGGRSIAIGTNNTINNAKQAITLGTNNELTNGEKSIAIGTKNNVTGEKSIAIGTENKISGKNSGAFGDPNNITGNYSYAIGNSNTIAVANAFVIGNDAQATVENAVALGNKSIAGAAATVNGYDPVTGTAHVLDDENDLQSIPVWKATAGTVSVGGGTTKRKNEQGQYLNAAGRVVSRESQAADITMTRQITNVAAGSELTDAVNVAQLMAAQVEIVGGDNVEVIKENSNGHIKYTIHSLNAMVEAGENITVTAETPDTTEETNGKTTDLTAEGDGTTGGSGSTGETGGTTAEPTASDEPITPSDTNNHTTTYTIDAKDTRNTVKAGDNITVEEKKNDDGSSTYTISAQAATNVKVIDGENTTVTEGKDGDFTTYAVNVKTDGEVAPGNTGIVTGDTVYNETRVKKDGNYIKKDNTAAENITALDEKVKDNSTRIDNINNEFNNMDNRMKKGLAGAAALAALHPLDFDPDDKWEFSAGVGNYRGETAAAIGAFYHPNDDTIFSLGATVGNGENMVNGGVTFRFGQKNHQSRSKKAMAKEIVELRAEVAELKAMVYSMANGKMPGLDLTRTEEFPDTPENHWAYDYVSVLAGNGVLEGYPDGYFKGERTLTRYEMAAIIYRAMMKGVDVDKRMAEEFAPELARVKVDTLTSHNDGTPSIQRVRVIEGRE